MDSLLDQLDGRGMTEEDGRRKVYRAAFLTAEGKEAFELLLVELKFLEACENEQDMALNNFAKYLVEMVHGDRILEENRGILDFIKSVFRRKAKK